MFATEKEVRGAFWATYFNTATNNLLSVVQYLGGERRHPEERVAPDVQEVEGLEDSGAEKLKDCPAIQELLKQGTEANLVRQIHLMKRLQKYFPFMKIVREDIERGDKKATPPRLGREVTPREFAEIFLEFATYLYELRNYFTHVEHAPVKLGNMKPCRPGILFSASVRTVKERFYKSDGKDDSRFNQYRKLKGKGTDGKPKPNPDYRFYIWEKGAEKEMTPQGLAFFASFFLEKKYISMMLDVLVMDSDISNWPEDSVLLKRVFMVNCIRLPRTRLECAEQMTDQTLGLDILGHLHKCPKEIFEMLSPENQNTFRTVSEETGQEVLLMRSRDRFSYLALNYLDRREAFSKIRFSINMGNYYYRCHRREVIDGSVLEERRIPKRILWFQRMQDAIAYYQTERTRPGTLYHLPQEFITPPLVYRNDMSPQYAIHNQQIGIRLIDGELAHPELDPEGRVKPRMLEPECWLSLYELPALLWLATHGRGGQAQNAIVEYVKNWRGFLKSLCENQSSEVSDLRSMLAQWKLDMRNLPEEIQYCIKNGKVKPVYLKSDGPKASHPVTTDEAAEAWLVDELERTRRTIRGLESDSQYDFKLGKSKTKKFHSGRIAHWLVRDFMRLQKSNGNARDKWGKIKSAPDYMALEAALTCFNQSQNSLEALFQTARLYNGKDYDHPFLKKVLKSSSNLVSLVAFFKAYLKERVEWLRTIDGDEVYPLRRLYTRGEKRSKATRRQLRLANFLRETARKLLEQPVNLPRNLFEPLVRDCVKSDFPEQWQTDAMDDKRANSTWLLMKTLEWSGDRPQWFYDLPKSIDSKTFGNLFAILGTAPRYDVQGVKRLEEILKLGRGTRERELRESLRSDYDFRRLSYDKKEEEIARRMEAQDAMFHRLLAQYGEHEKDIRHVRLEDMVLLSTLPILLDLPADKIRLADMKPETGQSDEESILNGIVEMSMTVILPQKMGSMKLTGTMKRKNYGNFQRMRNDIRLPSLLRWMKEAGMDSVSYVQLENEFDIYDRVVRPEIFKQIYELERAVLAKYPDLKKKNGFIDFWPIAGKATANEAEQLILSVLRNAFAHQYYPDFQPSSRWKEEDLKTYAPLFQKVRQEIQDIRTKFPQCKDSFILAIQKYANNVFQRAINWVEK